VNDNILFKIGNKYRNRKGLYEVISISSDSMIIQWENGEKISTTVGLQQRIIEGMEIERQEMIKLEPKGKKKLKNPERETTKVRNTFSGFKENDFKGNVAGTNWRSRSGLGGAVTERLDERRFKSWDIYRMPSVQWDDIKHRVRGKTHLQAKFVAQLDESNLYYGFYVERSDKSSDERTDWNGFLSWVSIIENEICLNQISKANDLSVFDKGEKSFRGIIKSHNNKWRIHGQEHKDIDSLSAFLQSLPETIWLDLIIAKIENKEEVLNKGGAIAGDISKLFEILMPLYNASIKHST
jgi:hypothetical protein